MPEANPHRVLRLWDKDAVRAVPPVTAPVDPVEALARVVFEAGERAKYPGDESRWDDWKDGQDGDTARAQARAALAHARGLVPPESMSIEVRYREAWNNCRAETLRRLGGEGM